MALTNQNYSLSHIKPKAVNIFLNISAMFNKNFVISHFFPSNKFNSILTQFINIQKKKLCYIHSSFICVGVNNKKRNLLLFALHSKLYNIKIKNDFHFNFLHNLYTIFFPFLCFLCLPFGNLQNIAMAFYFSHLLAYEMHTEA